MTPLTVAAIAFVIALLLFGFAFWTPIYALPFVVLFLIGFGISRSRRKHGASELRDFRGQQPDQQDVNFTDRDRQTLYEGR